MYHLPFIFAADMHPQYTLSHMDEKYGQSALLRLFFADVTPEARASLAENCNDNPDNYLRWNGLTVRKESVVKVIYQAMPTLGNLNIHALPHSTTRITIAQSRQNYAIQTRMLPRKLESLCIYQNEIFGTIDLTSLPIDFTCLLAFENRICGPIDLTSLPKNLETLNLTFNRIDQKVVLYGNMPQSIDEISLACQRKVKHGIKAVRPISSENTLSKKKARKVFGAVRHYDT